MTKNASADSRNSGGSRKGSPRERIKETPLEKIQKDTLKKLRPFIDKIKKLNWREHEIFMKGISDVADLYLKRVMPIV